MIWKAYQQVSLQTILWFHLWHSDTLLRRISVYTSLLLVTAYRQLLLYIRVVDTLSTTTSFFSLPFITLARSLLEVFAMNQPNGVALGLDQLIETEPIAPVAQGSVAQNITAVVEVK
jgi:hypothetical protein